MNYKAEFNDHGELIWDEAKSKSPDLTHLQGAMFLDRPDLWPHRAKGQRKATKPLPGQIAFPFITEHQ